MNCGICGLKIESKEGIHWLEDVIVCTDCYEHETQEELA